MMSDREFRSVPGRAWRGQFFFIGESIFSRAGTVWVTESRKSRDLEEGARVAALQASGLGLGFGG